MQRLQFHRLMAARGRAGLSSGPCLFYFLKTICCHFTEAVITVECCLSKRGAAYDENEKFHKLKTFHMQLMHVS